VYTSRQLSEILLSNYFSNKDLGQNFIIDDKVIDYISDLAELNSNGKERKILEIGLGPGALTQKLLEFGHNVVGIEIDSSICEHISTIFEKEIDSKQLELIEGDALRLDWPSDITDIIANIPYQISSPLLEKLTQICKTEKGPENCIFMFQEEFARKINGGKDASSRGPLWITVSLDWEVKLGRKISPSSFKPQPKIESRLVSFKRRCLLNTENILSILDSKKLEPPTSKLIRAISAASFNHRRKKLRNTLKRQPSKLRLKHGYDPKNWEKIVNKAFLMMDENFSNRRPDELSLQEWIEFSAKISYFQKEFQTLS
jgi:16S rRNA (adenine1518-N6/adenine1519-N6)-dimethyltransferase